VKVRTTVTLEKDLLRQAKVEAAESDRTLSELIEEALRATVAASRRKRGRFKMPVFDGGQGLAEGVSPGELLKPWHLIDRLDRQIGERGDQPPGR
jgi:hypothetical protein